MTTAGSKQPSTLHVNFFDANDTMLYTFFKENPRTLPGHTAGDLHAPPAPGRGGTTSGEAKGTGSHKVAAMFGGAFLVSAVLLCLVAAASHARSQIAGVAVPKARAAVGESTPLVQPKRPYTPTQGRPFTPTQAWKPPK